jgi:hypothetical protein
MSKRINHERITQDSEHVLLILPSHIINEIIMPSWHFYATCHSLWDIVPEEVLKSLLRVKSSNNFKRTHAYTIDVFYGSRQRPP